MKQYIDVVACNYQIAELGRTKIRTSEYGSNSYSQTAFEKSIISDRVVYPQYMKMVIDLIRESYIDKRETGGNNWRVCFIPASTHHKTACRYQKLATFIEKETGIACDYHTILPIQDQESGHITGKKTNPAENFNIKTSDVAGKNIILIDDVITRGMTYVHTTNKLINNGANMVKGLFLAKTINPDWVRHSA
jgi:phosphoribosylpyrophosphate synthetase